MNITNNYYADLAKYLLYDKKKVYFMLRINAKI